MTAVKPLTKQKIAGLFKRDVTDIEVFDFIKDAYVFKFTKDEIDSKKLRNMHLFRDRIESVPCMADYKLVALGISFIRVPYGCKFLSANPHVYPIANIITFNKKTGEYVTNPNGWFGADTSEYNTLNKSKQDATEKFIMNMDVITGAYDEFLSGYNK